MSPLGSYTLPPFMCHSLHHEFWRTSTDKYKVQDLDSLEIKNIKGPLQVVLKWYVNHLTSFYDWAITEIKPRYVPLFSSFLGYRVKVQFAHQIAFELSWQQRWQQSFGSSCIFLHRAMKRRIKIGVFWVKRASNWFPAVQVRSKQDNMGDW